MPTSPATIRLTEWIRSHGGAAHTGQARAAGFTEHTMRSAVAVGLLQRVRRSWLVDDRCDERIRFAASIGGRVTCVTAATMAGLWTPDREATHFAVPRSSSRFESGTATVHWGTGPARVAPHTLRDTLVNALFHVANCLPPADALAIWESAMRTKSVDPDVVKRIAWRSSAASRIAAVADQLSDSGMETRFGVLMRDAGVAFRRQVWIDGHPVDALIGDGLVTQLDGFAFHQAADRRRDIRADARLVLRGYTVLRFDYQQVFFDRDHVVDTMQTAIAQGLHHRRH